MRLLFAVSILILITAPAALGQSTGGQSAANTAANTQPAATSGTNKEKTFTESLKQDYPWCVLGILLSIVLPILRRLMPVPAPVGQGLEGQASYWSVVWPKIRPYVIVGLFSLLTGIIIIAFAGQSLADQRAAILAGYAWDSTFQKLAAR